MRAVNLLPRDVGGRRSRRSLSPVALVALFGAAVVATALSVGFLHARSTLDAKQSELEAAKVELAVTPKPARKPKKADNRLAAERAQRAEALGAAYSNRVAWDRVLGRFALVLPDDVWLTGLTANAPGASGSGTAPTTTSTSTSSSTTTTTAPASGAPTSGAPTAFVLTGYAYSHEGVARLLSRLEVVPDLTNVQLQTSARQMLSAGEIVQFTVVADVRTGDAS